MSGIAGKYFDINSVRRDFPIFHEKVNGKNLVYLDSASTAQKPKVVIDAISQFYSQNHANVHRGIYELSRHATAAFESARQSIRDFIGAAHNHEIIFTKGTTEAINLVIQSFGQGFIGPGDELIISTMDHHSNIVPCQLFCARIGAVLKVIRLYENQTLDLNHYAQMLNEKTRLVSVIHASNVLGTINPVKSMIEMAHQHNIPVLLDAAQSAPHFPINVQDLDCDFLTFSGHKLYGPTGFGILYGKEKYLEAMPPYQGGGDMIRNVSFDKTTYNDLPYKFEAGTPPIAGAIGTAAAIDYLNKIGFEAIQDHEKALLDYATNQISMMSDIHIIGKARKKLGLISFLMNDVHPHDIGTIVDQQGVAIRVGHHCAMPLMNYLGLAATARLSFGIYNTFEDVDCFIESLRRVRALFHV